MSWVVAGVAAGTAVLGAVNAANQRKAQQNANQQQANISAAQTQFSPWTGIKPQQAQFQPITASPIGGAEQGALAGAMTGLSIKKGMDPNNPDPNAPQPITNSNPGYMPGRSRPLP